MSGGRLAAVFGAGRFSCRVAGVAIQDGRVLLQGEEHRRSWTLPGGGLELMEHAVDGLTREMREELGVAARVERLLWVVESFWTEERRAYHEIGFHFLMTLPPEPRLHPAEGSFQGYEIYNGLPIIFEWFPVEAVADLPLYPLFLRHALRSLPDTPTHIVNDERTAEP
jgi:ADP-ribose pyrophosphatase YjhB (NUDIX family)